MNELGGTGRQSTERGVWRAAGAAYPAPGHTGEQWRGPDAGVPLGGARGGGPAGRYGWTDAPNPGPAGHAGTPGPGEQYRQPYVPGPGPRDGGPRDGGRWDGGPQDGGPQHGQVQYGEAQHRQAQNRLVPQGQVPQGQVPQGQVPQGQVPQGQLPHGRMPGAGSAGRQAGQYAGPPHPASPDPGPARPNGAPGAPGRPRRGRVGRWIGVAVVVAALGGVGWYVTFGAPSPVTAAVGDCVSQTGENDVEVVGCGEAGAQFRVAGRVENTTMIQASLFACSDFPDASSSFWQGVQDRPGTVLCLAPLHP